VTFGQLTPCELAIMEYLLQCQTWVTKEKLSRQTADASRLYDHAAEPRKAKSIAVHVFNIREKLGDGAIINMPDRGYMLGAPGVLHVRALQTAKAVFEAAKEGKT
jgi:DNA-binding response OmpR family regulator